MATFFQKIIDREIPATIVYEDDQAVAFKDINPGAPFHVLVIPKKPLVNVGAMAPEDEQLVGHCLLVCQKVAGEAGLSDFRVVTNNGEGAGQSVFHLHFHVIPAYEGVELGRHGQGKADDAELAAQAKAIAAALG